MKNQNIMEDPDDLGLQAVMGDRFQDQTKEIPTAGREEGKPDWGKKDRRKEEPGKKALDASWVPVKAEPTELRRLAECAKQTVLYGGISVVLFWWQQVGLLASKAAVPSFIFIALLVGINIGRYMPRR